MRRFSSTILLGLFLASAVAAGGTVFETSFYSTSLGQEKCVQVYLPEGYSPDHGRRYPVIYFLHGALDGYAGYTYMGGVLDELIADGDIGPVIMIKPEGFTSPYPAGFYTSSALYGDWQGYISEDLVEWTDNSFRTLANRPHRAVMGHSMGGYAAIVYCGLYPDIYQTGASNCGAMVDLEVGMVYNVAGVLAELEGPPYEYNPTAGFSNGVLFSMAGAFSPNLANPPWYVDLPLDEWGEIIPGVMDTWMEHDVAVLLEGITEGRQPPLYMDIGTMDEFHGYPGHEALVQTLDEMGIEYEYQVFVGGHFDQLPERSAIAIQFLCDAMPGYAGRGRGLSSESPAAHILGHKASPNPCSERATIEFQLAGDSHVDLTVYDMAGRKVFVLCDEDLGAGAYARAMETDGLPAGVYSYVLSGGDDTATGRFVLAR